MRFRLIIAFISCWSALAFAADAHPSNPDDALAGLFSKLDLQAAKKQAELVLRRNSHDPTALFVRMEVAELETDTNVVLDSALRLCQSQAPTSVLQIASARFLRHAGNSQAFRVVVPRAKAIAQQENECSTDLKLALVTAAADGDTAVDLAQAATSAGLLTRWQMAGPFGHYSYADFDRKWEPETDRFSHAYYGKLQTEQFLFPDGLVTLPEYFSAPGILYAASDFEFQRSEARVLEVLGPGPYAVFVDGRLAITHDSRFMVAASRESVSLDFSAGKHRVMVKFSADAAPFRVMIHPQSRKAAAKTIFFTALNQYIDGLSFYFRDDFLALQRIVESDPSRTGDYLRALLYSAAEDHPAQARAAWQSLLPAALAQIKLAESGSSQSIADLARALPESEAAQQAAFESGLGGSFLERLLALHPSCSHLSAAVKFFGAHGQQEKAAKAEQQLASCGLESLAYPKALSAAGRHGEAADYLEKLLKENPLNRAVRRMLIQELLLRGQDDEAKQQAIQLHAIAPNSSSYARLAVAPSEVLNASSGRAAGFAQRKQFYIPYRRNGLQLIQQSAQRLFSGGPSVVLLNDKVVSLTAEGQISVYTHKITRLLNKDGIARFGEVSIPPGADLLELRTIKAGGQVIEPELALQKVSISMPALEPGDNIEEEFVAHYPNWDEAPDDAVEFIFGSFTAPILFSRFVLIAPETLELEISRHNVGAPDVEHSQGNLIQTWDRNDIAQTAWESDLPPENQLASVGIRPSENRSERLRDEFIAATRIGINVEQTIKNFGKPTRSDYETAKRLYRFVTTRIEASGTEWDVNTAEETLLNSQGSRTSALVALARSIGLKAELVVARQVGAPCKTTCYTAPLVRFWFANGLIVDADAESSNLPFGALSAALERSDALLISAKAPADNLQVTLKPNAGNDRSTAEAELFLDERGNSTVDMRITLGVERGRQIRALLRRSNERERQVFFDQLAIRIFPAAAQVTGSAAHEDDPEKPLELIVRCHVSQIVNPNAPSELEQLVPGLGLRDLYAKSAARNLPLYIDSLLFERTTFHVHLPANLQVRSLPADFTAHNEFGDYSARFLSDAQQITISREFRIPVQVVSQQQYAAFAAFARQIDEAERGKILLQQSRESARSASQRAAASSR